MRAIDADAFDERVRAAGGMSEEELTEDFKDGVQAVRYMLSNQPTIQPEIVRCKDCQYWNKGSCECPEHAVNCQDYYVGDIETEAEYFCGYAERREVTT